MKISLITLHRVPNYGSVLQAFATQLAIEKFGHSVEVLDYYPERMHFIGMLKRIKNKKDILKNNPVLCFATRCIMIPSYIKRFHVFSCFLKKHITLSDKTYFNKESIRNAPIEADVYCTGSDQVWNAEWNEGIDYPFFYDFGKAETLRIAYAASFGRSQLKDWEIDEMKRLLQKYKCISVRESSGVDILNTLNLTGSLVLDPTLLLNKSEWSKIASNKYKNKKYVLLYNLNRESELYKIAKSYAYINKMPLYSISYNLHEIIKPGKLVFCPKVEEWLSLIKNAQCVFSDSLHATAFSINFNTDFYAYYPHKFSTRLESLIKLTGFENRVISKSKVIHNEKIDFTVANRIIEKERRLSLGFLKEALEQ
ncbi:polysaccharide pyruvyl transferase [Ruminiclostridium sufflavum DSM 19573]|uniref:Polysaccharide pyruvyl transferase n=1 Tax=Ruminiclostridium sufflavum DSM 19573 TaxID=1121337 RepID=A0A318XH98_9FIRM|nr:polysaccharide pyruvyl transferase family protein [Ruminiclostridium sufflavum]PYG86560.1 polysaccharide pyruvyl transferase [Ruminiclostridium sufflavum DSM 19573]